VYALRAIRLFTSLAANSPSGARRMSRDHEGRERSFTVRLGSFPPRFIFRSILRSTRGSQGSIAHRVLYPADANVADPFRDPQRAGRNYVSLNLVSPRSVRSW